MDTRTPEVLLLRESAGLPESVHVEGRTSALDLSWKAKKRALSPDFCRRLVPGAVPGQQIQAAGSRGSQGLQEEGSIMGSVIVFPKKRGAGRGDSVCVFGGFTW